MRKVFRYVDDYLFLLESPASELLPDVDEILAMVKRKLAPLEITFELPVRNGIRFFGICFVRTPINTNNKYKRYDSLTELLRRAELPTIGQRAKILRLKFFVSTNPWWPKNTLYEIHYSICFQVYKNKTRQTSY